MERVISFIKQLRAYFNLQFNKVLNQSFRFEVFQMIQKKVTKKKQKSKDFHCSDEFGAKQLTNTISY